MCSWLEVVTAWKYSQWQWSQWQYYLVTPWALSHCWYIQVLASGNCKHTRRPDPANAGLLTSPRRLQQPRTWCLSSCVRRDCWRVSWVRTWMVFTAGVDWAKTVGRPSQVVLIKAKVDKICVAVLSPSGMEWEIGLGDGYGGYDCIGSM